MKNKSSSKFSLRVGNKLPVFSEMSKHSLPLCILYLRSGVILNIDNHKVKMYPSIEDAFSPGISNIRSRINSLCKNELACQSPKCASLLIVNQW